MGGERWFQLLAVSYSRSSSISRDATDKKKSGSQLPAEGGYRVSLPLLEGEVSSAGIPGGKSPWPCEEDCCLVGKAFPEQWVFGGGTMAYERVVFPPVVREGARAMSEEDALCVTS